MDQKIKELADSFFEWPTENKSFVTLTSALLFAEKIAEITKQNGRMSIDPSHELATEQSVVAEELNSVISDWNAMVTAIGSPTNEGVVGSARILREERDRYRVAIEKVIEFNLQHAKDLCGDETKAEAWACVRTLREALRDPA